MIMDREELRKRAIRLMAMAICAKTTDRYTRLLEMSSVAQIGAGVKIQEDDDEVQTLVAQYNAEDQTEAAGEMAADDWERDHPGARCPSRE